jgi:hypothetical protein
MMTAQMPRAKISPCSQILGHFQREGAGFIVTETGGDGGGVSAGIGASGIIEVYPNFAALPTQNRYKLPKPVAFCSE